MAVCATECQSKICTSGKGNPSIINFPFISPIMSGNDVTLSFDIFYAHCIGCFQTPLAVCIRDTDDNNRCVVGNYYSNIYPGDTQHVELHFTMPNRNFHGLVSVSDGGSLLPVCFDYKYFQIDLDTPPGTTWGCNPANRLCEPGYGTFPDSTCAGTCTGGGGGFGTCPQGCPTGDMCVMGTCLPKPMVFLGFGLIALYIMSKG